jgi:tetratricopeptide (TPR) repeat protein
VAIRLKPDYADAHYNLGRALSSKGQTDEAIAAYREAIRLAPDFPEAHCNLGMILLRRKGECTEALTLLRRGHELGSKRGDWRYPSAEWVRQAEQFRALAERLPAVLAGKDTPKDAAAALAFGQLCHYKGLDGAATRFYGDAFSARPELADDLMSGQRYNAACYAARAGAGEVKDDPPPDEVARTRLRAQALAWLRADLEAWTRRAPEPMQAARDEVRVKMRHWQTDPDLAGVRDAEPLARLPESERTAWTALWAEVDTLLAKARDERP